MRTLTLVLLIAACGGSNPEDTGPLAPEDGCLSAPDRLSIVNRESSRPVSRTVSVRNACGVPVTAAVAIEGADGVTLEDGPGTVDVPDGESVAISVSYLPDAPGEVTASLSLDPEPAELSVVEVAITAEAPGPTWSIGLLIQDTPVRECAGEMQARFENVGDGKGVRPKATISATDADVELTRSVLPEEGAANLTVSPVVLHAAEAEVVVGVDDAFAGTTTKTFTVEADPLAERDELFAKGSTGPVILAEAPIEASISVEAGGLPVTGWTLAGLELTLPDSVDRAEDDVIVAYVAASACD